MKQFWSWLVTSSADPAAYSLALKGMLTTGAGFLVPLLPVVCSFVAALCFVDAAYISQAIDIAMRIVEGVLIVVGGVMAFLGLRRKVVLGRWSAY